MSVVVGMAVGLVLGGGEGDDAVGEGVGAGFEAVLREGVGAAGGAAEAALAVVEVEEDLAVRVELVDVEGGGEVLVGVV